MIQAVRQLGSGRADSATIVTGGKMLGGTDTETGQHRGTDIEGRLLQTGRDDAFCTQPWRCANEYTIR